MLTTTSTFRLVCRWQFVLRNARRRDGSDWQGLLLVLVAGYRPRSEHMSEHSI